MRFDITFKLFNRDLLCRTIQYAGHYEWKNRVTLFTRAYCLTRYSTFLLWCQTALGLLNESEGNYFEVKNVIYKTVLGYG